MQEVTWKGKDAMEIISLTSKGEILCLFKNKMPKLLYRVMRQARFGLGCAEQGLGGSQGHVAAVQRGARKEVNHDQYGSEV